MTRRRPPSEPEQPGCGALPVECPASALCEARRSAGWSFRHNAVPGTSRCGAAAASSASQTPTARGQPPPTPPREAKQRSLPPAWPHTTGTAPASCTKMRAGTPRDTRHTAPGRSRSHRGRSQGTAGPARRRSPARTLTAVRASLRGESLFCFRPSRRLLSMFYLRGPDSSFKNRWKTKSGLVAIRNPDSPRGSLPRHRGGRP